VVAALIVVATVVAAVALVVSGFLAFNHTVDSFGRVPLNGGGRLEFTGTGGFTVYYESDAEVLDHIDAAITMTRVDGGQRVR